MALAGLFLTGCGGGDEEPDSTLTPPAPGLTDEVSDEIVDACEEALAKSRAARLYCPPIVPTGQSTAESAGEYVPGSYVISFQNEGIEPEPHWLIEGGAARGALAAQLKSKFDTPRRLGVRHVSGVAVRLYEIDFYDINMGHVVALWHFEEKEYVASVHGFANKKLALGIARGLIEQQQTCVSDQSIEVCDLVLDA